MAVVTFTITQGDTAPPLEPTLRRADGTVQSLSDATGVTFTMRNAQDDTVKIDAEACTIVNAAGGVVRYQWTGTDTDTVGEFLGKFTVTWTSGTTTSFPTDPSEGDNYITVNVVDNAGTVG